MANKEFSTTRSSGRAYKATGMVVVILFLFYLVLYLKENAFTYKTFFSNYDNAIDVWNEGFNFFQDTMNTIDTITSFLGKVFNFIVNSVDSVITFFQDKISAFKDSVYGFTWFQWLKDWAYNTIRNIFF